MHLLSATIMVGPMTQVHPKIALPFTFAVAAVLATALAWPRRIHAGAALSITEADNGEAIDLVKDDILIISLEANASTGYQWQITKNDASIMKPAGRPDYRGGKSGMIGAPGHAVFTFVAIASGKDAVELGYSRPWEKGVAPAKTFGVSVMVN